MGGEAINRAAVRKTKRKLENFSIIIERYIQPHYGLCIIHQTGIAEFHNTPNVLLKMLLTNYYVCIVLEIRNIHIHVIITNKISFNTIESIP